MANKMLLRSHRDQFLRDTAPTKRSLADFLEWYHEERLPVLGAASFSDYAEVAILNHVTGKSAMTSPSTFLGLATTIPTDATTGATLAEAAYTSYARVATAAGAWNTASSGSPSSITNSGILTFPNCTGSSSTVVGFALLDSATLAAGNIIVWGSTTSVTINTTQTPPTIAASALQITLD